MLRVIKALLESKSSGAAASRHDELTDISEGLRSWRIWSVLGWHDIRQRYRRSVLGPFWFTLSTAIMVVVLGALYSTLLKQEVSEYLPFLAAGLVVWQFLASVMNEGCNAFISSAALIKQIRLPLTVHVCRITWRNFLILLHNLPVLLALLIFFGHRPGFEIILLPFGLLLLLLHGVWLGVVLGALCARFRDVPPIASNVVQVAFFFTPIMWMPEIIEDRAGLIGFVDYNPFYHLIEIVRAPMIGRPLHWEAWSWSMGLLIVGFSIAHLLMKRTRNRIPYWL